MAENGATSRRVVPSILALAACLLVAQSTAQPVTVSVNFNQPQDTPLFKKYAVMNSGLIEAQRYNDSIIASFGLIKASAFVTDLYMGTSNQNASFGTALYGAADTASQNGGIQYNLSSLDYVSSGLNAVGVTPYWAITYAPEPFQPSQVSNSALQLAMCLGYQTYPDTSKYNCRPINSTGSSAGFDDCWKCPPKDVSSGFSDYNGDVAASVNGSGFSQYADALAALAMNEKALNVTVYKQIWNEPDLTSYFNYTAGGTTFFHGTKYDYNAMYAAGSTAMKNVDPDLVVGGPGLAYWIQTDPVAFPDDLRVSGTSFVEAATNLSLPVDFFSFHAVAACTDSVSCDVENNGGEATFMYRSGVARYALTEPAGGSISPNEFNATEIHCTEYYAGTQADQYGLPYSASTNLGALMLNNFLTFLDQTDVTQVTWAQYMDVTCCNGTGLLDYYGNARPSWHAFRFWGDIPIERVVATTSNPTIIAASGFDTRTCHGGVLVWNNGTADVNATVTVESIPYKTFTVQVYILDANHLPGPGYEMGPVMTLNSQQPDANSTWTFPVASAPVYTLTVGGILYLNITGDSCQLRGYAPNGRILRTHHYYDKRPYATYMYGEFDKLNWAAYIGMGNETVGTALAGATVVVDPTTIFNITMNFINIAPPPNTPASGMRVDFWDPDTETYPANSSIFFYQTGTQPGAQIPLLYGSKAPVPDANFFYVNLADFVFNPTEAGYPKPAAWDGKLIIIFMLQNGTANSSIQAYITEQSIGPAVGSTLAATAGR